MRGNKWVGPEGHCLVVQAGACFACATNAGVRRRAAKKRERTRRVYDKTQSLLTLKNLRIEACLAPLLPLPLPPLRLALGGALALARQARSLRDSHGSTLNVIFLHLLQNGHGLVTFERAIEHVVALRMEQILSNSLVERYKCHDKYLQK